MSIKNCPDCCFTGDIDDDKAYPFGVLTEEESDAKYAKKGTEQTVKSLETKAAQLESKKADKSELENLSEITAGSLSALKNSVNDKAGKDEVNELASGKADKSALQSLESVVRTKANSSEVSALAQTIENKADKSDIKDLGLVIVDGLLCVEYER